MKRIYILLLLLNFSILIYAQDSGDALIHKGVSLHENGKYQEAIRYYEEALKLSPSSMPAIYELSLSYLHLKDYGNALKYSTQVIDANYQSLIVKAVSVKSTALAELGELDQSIKLLNDAVAKYGDEYFLHYNLGLSYFKQKNYVFAIKHLNKAIEIDPTHPDVFLLYAYSLNDTDRWVESFLSFHFFILLEPNTERSQDVFDKMYDILNQAIEPESPKLEIENGIDRQKLYSYLQKIKPSNKLPDTKYRYFEQASKSIFFTLGQIQDNKKSGIMWDFFVPIYSEILKSGYFETYCRYVSACYFPQSMEWWKRSDTEVNRFIAWFENGEGT